MHVDARRWIGELSAGVKRRRPKEVARSLRGAFNGPYYTLTTRYPFGTNIYERDWDLLLVLDACRVDALREVAPEYEFIETVDSIWSVGSASHEWICKTFTNEHREAISETALITSNPFFPQVLDDRTFPPKDYAIPLMWPDWDVVDSNAFAKYLHVHRHDYDEYFPEAPPQVMSDYAINAAREGSFERMVVHYLQPHTPYIAEAYEQERALTDVEADPWTALAEGTATVDEVEALYLANLRFVLDSVETLLANVDAPDVVITADHGELFGELGLFGHPEGVAHPALKKVPWATATATDTGERTPAVDETQQSETSVDTEQRLADLGYL
jgi:hypothetical protein